MTDLKTLAVHKRPAGVTLAGRILFLTEDPALLSSQLDGQDLEWNPAIKLRDDISTDEITPAYTFGARYGASDLQRHCA